MSLRIIQSARNDLKFKDFMIHYREIRASFIANGATSGQPLAPLPPSLMIVEDLAKERDSNGPDMERYSYTIGQKHLPMNSTFTNSPFLMQRNDFLPKASVKNNEEQDSSNESKSAPTMLYMNSELDKPLLSTKHATVLSTVPEQSDMSMSMNSMTMVQGLSSPPVTNSDPQHHGGIPNSLTISKDWTPSADILAHKIFMHDPTILSSAIDVDEILLKNQIHRLALFITMFCSILQAAFFSYLTNVSSNDNITLYLFFIRMFSDLLGRPLALIRPRIIFFQTIKGVLIGTIIRATFMFLFFFYIFTPKGLIYRNDYMILIFQVSIHHRSLRI